MVWYFVYLNSIGRRKHIELPYTNAATTDTSSTRQRGNMRKMASIKINHRINVKTDQPTVARTRKQTVRKHMDGTDSSHVDSNAPRTIYFDMDGTIANFYDVPNWLPRIRSYDATPYRDAKPRVDMTELNSLVIDLKRRGYSIGIVSWLSMDGSNKKFNADVRQAKREWLAKWFPYADEVHIVKHGTPKHKVVRNARNGILVDDEERNVEEWRRHGLDAIDASNPHTMLAALEMATCSIVE